MIRTSLEVEQRARAGDYVADDNRTISEMAATITDAAKVRDAIKRGRRGVALLFDNEGEMEVVNLGGSEINVRSATKEEALLGWQMSYEQMNSGEEWERAKTESHKPGNKTAGKFPPVNKEGPRSAATNDTATADARRKQMTADAKRLNQEAYARNERIAQRMKQASDKIWKKSA